MADAPPPLAHRDRRGVWRSEGHRRFAEATHWAAGAGHRPSLDVLAAQLREAGVTVGATGVSNVLNGYRAPSLFLAGAIERVFGIPAGAWSLAPRKRTPLAVDSNSSTSSRRVATIGSREMPPVRAAE